MTSTFNFHIFQIVFLPQLWKVFPCNFPRSLTWEMSAPLVFPSHSCLFSISVLYMILTYYQCRKRKTVTGKTAREIMDTLFFVVFSLLFGFFCFFWGVVFHQINAFDIFILHSILSCVLTACSSLKIKLWFNLHNISCQLNFCFLLPH